MEKAGGIYMCSECRAVVEVLHAGTCKEGCCGGALTLLEEKSSDEGREKHVPVIEKTGKGIKVKVGTVEHPMEENHYIEWIEAIEGSKRCRKFLKPGEKPEAEFEGAGKEVKAREYCSVHGLWKG
jgi:superoxide reductase